MCVLAQEFAQRLTLFGAPPDLIEGALRMALDELDHARLARVVCEAAGSTGAVVFHPSAYSFDASPDPAVHVAVLAVPNLCLGETLALRIVHRLRRNARVPGARSALDRVVGDEPRHAALGWETLDWLLSLPAGEAVWEAVESDLPRWVATLPDSFAGPCVEPHLVGLLPEDLAWGLASPETQRGIFEESVERDWALRLARRGLRIT